MYGGKGAGVVSTVVGGGVVAAMLPVTGGANSLVSVAVSVFSGLVVWGASYSLLNR